MTRLYQNLKICTKARTCTNDYIVQHNDTSLSKFENIHKG